MRPILCVLLALLPLGCKGSDSKSPESACEQLIDLELSAGEHLNPGDDGGALPVVVRYYQLKDRVAFEASDFRSIWQEDAQALGGDLLERTESTLFPATRDRKRLVRKPEASYLAVVALFRNPLGTDWRQIQALPEPAAVEKYCKQKGEKQKGPIPKIIAASGRLLADGSLLSMQDFRPKMKQAKQGGQ